MLEVNSTLTSKIRSVSYAVIKINIQKRPNPSIKIIFHINHFIVYININTVLIIHQSDLSRSKQIALLG